MSQDYDFIVMGAGSAGLAAALRAADLGLKVLVLEKSAKIGGTSAWSGGAIWAPANSLAQEAGHADSIEEATDYLYDTAPEGWRETEAERLRALAENSGAMIDLLRRKTPLRFDLLPDADLFMQAKGAKAKGRMLTPALISQRLLGRHAKNLRQPKLPLLFTFKEVGLRNPLTAGLFYQMRLLPKIIWRFLRQERGMGAALMVGLYKGCFEAGCEFRTDARVVDFIQDETGKVCGVKALVKGRAQGFTAKAGVLIASGGFEWNEALLAQHFPGPIEYRGSPRSNEGDGHLLAQKIGAELGHMDQANFNSCVPGLVEGQVQGLGWFYHIAPNSCIVNGKGERFFNEEDHNLGLALDARDAQNCPIHLPAWFISDEGFARSERIAMYLAKCAPDWVIRADSISALAKKIGVDAQELEKTVKAFNAQSPDPFGRENRQSIGKGGYLAISFNRSFISTKGGPRTDAKAQVLRPDGSVIEGLYCAGVAMDNPLGTKGIASGTTLGPNMTWGYIAAETAAQIQRGA